MSNPHRRARREKRNRPYRPRDVRTPMIVGAHLVLDPLERIVAQIDRDGTTSVDERGTPVFQDGNGQWYDAAGAIEGVVWHFEMMATRHGLDLPLDGLRELVIAFRYLVPIQASTMAKLRAALPVLRQVMAGGDPADQVDILQQTRIKAELEAASRTQGA